MTNLVLSVVTLCLAVMVLPGALTQKCRKGGFPCPDKVDEEVWLFHFGPTDSREEYLNPLTGEVNGYHVDVLNAVCAIAKKNCRMVYDRSQNCWDYIDGQLVGGTGLFNFYYDACTAWYPTFDRLRTFQFSTTISLNKGSGFAVLTGNPDNFNPADLTGLKIGFIQGFFINPACVAKQTDTITGADLSDDQIVYYDGVETLKEAIRTGEIAAGFDWGANYHNQVEFDHLHAGGPIICSVDGPAMMTRKDSTLNAWMNPALEILLASDEYQDICDGLEQQHGHKSGPDRWEVCKSNRTTIPTPSHYSSQ